MTRTMRIAVFLSVILVANAWSHVGLHPSVHDTVAGILERVKQTQSPEELSQFNLEKAQGMLTEEERHILSGEYLTFRVNVPVKAYLIRDVRLINEPFWLADRGFRQTEMRVNVGDREFDVWEAPFDAGAVGLGVNSLTGGGRHYFVGIGPRDSAATLEITEIYPGGHTLGTLAAGERPYADLDATITELPQEIRGIKMLRGLESRRKDTQLINVFRVTPYPATDKPDHIVLTWSEDPRTTQTIQWRTSVKVGKGAVTYQKRSDSQPQTTVEAETKRMETPSTANDPVVNRHSVVLRGLEPGTTYEYAVGDGSPEGWSERAEFKTAPAGAEPFSFIYLGDAQNGLDRWGVLVRNAFQRRPDAAFWIMAGDLVNRGADRDDWDSLFQNAAGVYDRRQVVPALGNHEYHNGEPKLYLEHFGLPVNGPAGITPEKVYALKYSNALFLILDSNLPAETQTAWLEEQLASTDATWKFVVYHHPAYASAPNRDNHGVRTVWGAIFDKYHVDLALQGHDHAYLRTYPMKNQQRVGSPKEGTIYIVAVSGTKYYTQVQRDYTEVGMTNVSTYQVLDIHIQGNRMVYRAHDVDGTVRDEFIIEK